MPIEVCVIGLDEVSTVVPVMKMFQPPCAGGSFLARRDTTEPQSIAWTSSFRKPALRSCWIITRLAGLMYWWSVACRIVIGSPL